MTQEEKSKRYDEAVREASIAYKDEDKHLKATLERIFPELKESEDERIRNFLHHTFTAEYLSEDKLSKWHGEPVANILAWLEKQGEKSQGKSALEAINEEKADNANKVEPKFKVGDWVIDKQGIVHQIANVVENVNSHTYGYDIVGGGYFNDNTEGVRLWTIKDAKNGNILVSKSNQPFIYNGNMDSMAIGSHGGVLFDGTRFICGSDDCNWTENRFICPATKEQCDLLFSKMEEAGYKLDKNFNVIKI